MHERDDEPEDRIYWHLFVSEWRWSVGILDSLLLRIANDEFRNAVILLPASRSIYHPYDGGADVVLPTPPDRDKLKDMHRNWLSDQSSGL